MHFIELCRIKQMMGNYVEIIEQKRSARATFVSAKRPLARGGTEAQQRQVQVLQERRRMRKVLLSKLWLVSFD